MQRRRWNGHDVLVLVSLGGRKQVGDEARHGAIVRGIYQRLPKIESMRSADCDVVLQRVDVEMVK